MALQYAHGVIHWLAADAVSTTYQVTGLSFQPKALKFSWSGNYASGTTDVVGAISVRRGVGFAVSTSSRRCVGSFSQSGSADTNAGSIARNDCVVCTTDGAGGGDSELDLSAIASDGFTLIVDDQGVVNLTVSWEAWGGTDISVAVVGDIAEPAATGNVDYTVTGFVSASNDDQIVMFGGVQSVAALNTGEANDNGFTLGYAGGNALGNVILTGNSDDASATSDTDYAGYGGDCIGQIILQGGNTLSGRAQLTQFGTDNFRLNWLARATTSRRSIFLAIKGGRWKVGSLTINYSVLNSTAAVSGLAFTPKGMNCLTAWRAANTAGAAGTTDLVCWGCGTSTTDRFALASRENSGEATANATFASHEHDQVLTDISVTGTKPGSIDISAMASDGFTLIVDDASGSTTDAWVGYMTWGDQPGVINTNTRDDTLAVSDNNLRSALFNRRREDTMALVDQSIRTALHNRRHDEAVTLTDAGVQRQFNVTRSDQTISLTDEKLRGLIRGRVSDDTITLTDAALRYLIRGRTMDDAITLVDEFIKQVVGGGAIQVRTSTDTIDLLDQNLRTVFRIRFRDDGIVVTDNTVRTATRHRRQEELLVVVDALISTALRNRLKDEAVTLDDHAFRTAVRGRLKDEAVTLYDERLMRRMYNRFSSDALLTSDQQYRMLSLVRVLDDGHVVTDYYIKSVIGPEVPQSFIPAVTARIIRRSVSSV